MKVATWNINGVVRRLPLLLDWLARAQPDIVALQETKATDAEFPTTELAAAGYGAVTVGQRPWNGVALLARGAEPIVVRRALPGDAGDTQARYLEAAIGGVLVASIYLPNGNPQPGPKFAYKLAWFERLIAHAASLQASGHPVLLAGDFNVVPTDRDIYPTTSSSAGVACRATPTTPTAATSRRPRTAWWWGRSTCPTAIRSPGRSSPTSSPGSSGSARMRRA